MKYFSSSFQAFSNLFSVTCIVVSVLLTAYCTWQYCKNDDSSVVRFTEYNQGKDDIYPGITICLSDAYKSDTFSYRIEQNMYHSFIAGRNILETELEKRAFLNRIAGGKSILKSRFSANRSKRLTADQEEMISNFTRKLQNLYESNDVKNINDYLLFGSMSTYQPRIPPRTYHYPSNQSLSGTNWIPNFYPSFSSTRKRCLTFEPPNSLDEKVASYSVLFNRSIFYGRRRPSFGRFEVRLSYPGQQLTAPAVKLDWGKNESKIYYTMKFEIQNVIVMKRRNKLTASCEEDWKQNDKVLIKKMASDVKCILPHWNMNSTLPYCQGKQLTRIGTKFNEIRNNIPPCQEIEKIIYTYNEINGLENFVGKVGCSTGKCMSDYMKRLGINYNHPSNDVIQVQLTFQGERYMEITQVRAYDGQSLIGNAGGYVGLFLGVALIQLPAAFQYFFQMLKK